MSAALGIVQALTGIAAVGSMSFLLWTVQHGWETMELWRAVLDCDPAAGARAWASAFRSRSAWPRDRAARERGEFADRIGRLYSLNVAGAILGSLGRRISSCCPGPAA